MSAQHFAGFPYPKKLGELPRGSLAQRLTRFHQPRLTGGYFQNVPGEIRSRSDCEKMFYLDSDFMPGLRWQWCDEVAHRTIRHHGWFCDEFQDSTIRGLVMRLPANRVFLAGWSMGEGMISCADYSARYVDALSAALAADSWAERVAEDMRDDAQGEEQ